MAEIFEAGRKVYDCMACGTRFVVPRDETAVCCPVCRMNRIETRD